MILDRFAASKARSYRKHIFWKIYLYCYQLKWILLITRKHLPANIALLPRDAFKGKVVPKIHFLEHPRVVSINPLKCYILDHMLPARDNDKVMCRSHAGKDFEGAYNRDAKNMISQNYCMQQSNSYPRVNWYIPGMTGIPSLKCGDLKNSCTISLDLSGLHFQICNGMWLILKHTTIFSKLERRIPYLGKLIDPVVIYVIVHIIAVFAEQVQRVHKASKHCMHEQGWFSAAAYVSK